VGGGYADAKNRSTKTKEKGTCRKGLSDSTRLNKGLVRGEGIHGREGKFLVN